MIASCAAYAADQPPRSTPHSLDEPMEFDIPRLPAAEAASIFAELTGVNVQLTSCQDVPIGPLRGLYTPRKAWTELFSPLCLDLEVVDSAGLTPALVARERGSQQYDFHIKKQSRAKAFNAVSKQAGGLLLGYLSLPNDDDDRELVGPFRGRMSVQKILELVVGSADLAIRWADDDGVSIEPRIEALKKKSQCACTPNLVIVPPPSEQVTVTDSRLYELGEFSYSPILVFDRRRIDATGASSIPDLLRYIPQTSFTWSRGYRTSGAQNFEGRGQGAEYTLVLINGWRTFGSASDPSNSAFDLNTVPLSAVERVEVSLDAPSLRHGSDAIGGTVNIILKQNVDATTVEGRLGTARGGARERRGTLISGHDWGRARATMVFDYFDLGQLLGVERARWRNQDFTRYGGADERSRFAAPGNVRSIAGDLPGMDTSTAAIVFGHAGAELRADEVNRTSLRGFQAILPASERTSFTGVGSVDLGSATLKGEVLLNKRTASFQFFPSIIPGFVWGADHPQNPFGAPVIIETALTGLPIPSQEVRSDLYWAVTELAGSFSDWDYSVFALSTEEKARRWLANSVDPFELMRSLSGSDSNWLNVLAPNPGSGPVPTGLMASKKINRMMNGATQFGAHLDGQALQLPAGSLRTSIGIEHRQETVEFDPRVSDISRNVDSIFTLAKVPIVSQKMGLHGVRQLELSFGVRRDTYSDVRDVVRRQVGVAFRPIESLSVRANWSQSFRPNSLYEEHAPKLTILTQIYDPARSELTPIELLTGGNPELVPTAGISKSIEVSFESNPDFRASVAFWQSELHNQMSSMSPRNLFSREDLFSDRIRRAERTDADRAAGIPGRLESLDISRANFGDTRARGIDVTLERSVETKLGALSSRLDVTRTLAYESTVPSVAGSASSNRVGIASELGTIPSCRVVGSLAYERRHINASLFARYYCAYKDFDSSTRSVTRRKISGQTLLDFTFSKQLDHDITMRLGMANLLDAAPPFAEISNDVGFDLSQGDLTGRTGFFELSRSF